MTGFILVLAESTAWGDIVGGPHGYITIYENVVPGPEGPSDDRMVVDLSHLTGILGTPVVTTLAEYGSVSFTLTNSTNTNFVVPTSNRYVGLLEPGSTSVLSDIIRLSASNVAFVSGNHIQTVQVFFYSDGFVSFPTLPSGSPTVLETGSPQDMSGDALLNTNEAFNLYVMSDISEVPVPSALLVLGSGLLRLANYRRRKLASSC